MTLIGDSLGRSPRTSGAGGAVASPPPPAAEGPHLTHISSRRRAERGSALIIAVMAMLALSVLGLSLALLARTEADAGVSHRRHVEAEALAEGAIAHALDVMRPDVLGDGGFTRWVGRVVLDGVRMGEGTYWARVDDDCAPLVPLALSQAGCPGAGDSNGVAIVTAWAQAGTGRVRVRAQAILDRPWARVCAGARTDAEGLCRDVARPAGVLAITPSDPGDPSGPTTYEALPVPVLGCSRIDPSLHGATSACPAGSRLVLTGEDPGTVPAAPSCHEDPGGGRYFGYFDCALQTPCEPAVACPGGVTRGCVRAGDTRLTTQPTRYREPGPEGCAGPYPASATGDPSPATGMVFNHVGASLGARNPRFASLGAAGRGVTAYVLRRGADGQVELGGGATYGTLAIEGNGLPSGGDPCAAGNVDVRVADDALLSADTGAYGYPLNLLVYDPTAPSPTVSPAAPQSVCASLGTKNTVVQGVVYSAGRVRLGPVTMDGGVVAFEARADGPAGSLRHDARYVAGSAPPGFRARDAARVTPVWKSFVACASYRDERGSASPCP